MPIPAEQKEKLRHEVRRLLNRKGYKSRLHLVQKNEHVHDVGVPILGILEKRLDMEFDHLQRGFVLNEVRLTAKRASNKAIKNGIPITEPEKPKKIAKKTKKAIKAEQAAAKAAAAAAAAASAPVAAPATSAAAPNPQLSAMLEMLGAQFGLPTPALTGSPSNLNLPSDGGGETSANGKKVIYRQRLTAEQVEQLTTIAEQAEWSLLRIPRVQREQLSAKVGVTVGQLKNFFSNAKPKDKKKSLGKRKEDWEEPEGA